MQVLASQDWDIINSTAAMLIQDDWNARQHDFFSHLTILALASESCDTNAIVNSTVVFIGSRWLKKMCNLTLMVINAMMLVLVSNDANSVSNGIILFAKSRWSKENATWLFGHMMPLASASCDANGISQDNQNDVQYNSFGHVNSIGAGVSVTSCQQCCQWHQSHFWD